jgi:hypothetical protein
MGKSVYEGRLIMAKKEVVKGVTDFRVEIADNGFVLEFSGEDVNGDWANAKRIVGDPNALAQAIMKIVQEMT